MNEKNEPRNAAEHAEACSRDCQESSALCTWPTCACPAVLEQPLGASLFPRLVEAA